MSGPSADRKIGTRSKSEEQVKNLTTNTITFLTRRPLPSGQFASQNPSDSDTVMHKSDSDDALFLTDSSDEIPHDKAFEQTLPNESLLQTRETIMESLTQSFVSVSMNNSEEVTKPDEPSSSNCVKGKEILNPSSLAMEEEYKMQQDIQFAQPLPPMCRIPSDLILQNIQQAIPNYFFLEFSEVREPSEEYITVDSTSEVNDDTAVSFFSQAPSTGYLQVLTKIRPHKRSKSASNVHRKTTLCKERRVSCSQSHLAECCAISDSCHKDNLTAYRGLKDIGPLEQPTLTLRCRSAEAKNKPERRDDSEMGKVDSRSTALAKNKLNPPLFKARKLPKFYARRKAKDSNENSKSDSCMLPSDTERRKSVSPQRHNERKSRSPIAQGIVMTRSTSSERSEKKDAGGISYAEKHLHNSVGDSSAKRSPRGTERPVTVLQASVRAKSSPSTSYAKPYISGNVKVSRSESAPPRNQETMQEGKRGRSLPLLKCPKPSPRKGQIESSNLEATYKGKMHNQMRSQSVKTKTENTLDSLRKMRRIRPGSPIKVSKQHANKPEEIRSECNSNLNNHPTVTNSSGSILTKSSSIPFPNTSAPVLHSSTPQHGAPIALFAQENTGEGPRKAAATTDGGPFSVSPALMSLKVDVSVRAEDGSVHTFYDISPKRDTHSTDLFSGVEEFICNLLESSGGACGSDTDHRIIPTPVSARSPKAESSPLLTDPEKTSEVPTGSPPLQVENGSLSPVSGDKKYGTDRHVSSQPWTNQLDTYDQKLNPVDGSSILTSTGSMASSDVLAYSRYSGLKAKTKSDAKLYFHKLAQEDVAVNPSFSPRLSSHWSPERRPRDPSPKRPVSAGHRSPRSRIPVSTRILHSDSVSIGHAFKSRSTTPEQRSLYQTAQTSPERPRSATPNSLSSLGGSSQNSVVRSSYGKASGSAQRKLFPVSNKTTSAAQSRSPLPHVRTLNNHTRSPDMEKEEGEYVPEEKVIFYLRGEEESSMAVNKREFRSEESGFYTELTSEREEYKGIVETKPSSCSEVPNSFTDNDPIARSSEIELQEHSVESVQHRSSTIIPACKSPPIPAERLSIHAQSLNRAQPVPMQRQQKFEQSTHRSDLTLQHSFRQSHHEKLPLLRSASPHQSLSRASSPGRLQSLSHERLTSAIENELNSDRQLSPGAEWKERFISKKPSLCTVGSPQRNISKSPAGEDASSKDGDILVLRSSSCSTCPHSLHDKRPFLNEWIGKESQPQPFDETKSPIDFNHSCQYGLERQTVEIGNTMRLMEQAIEVLEQQNQTLVTNSRQLSLRLGQEKAKKNELKTAKNLLLRVRKKLETTINSSAENENVLKSMQEDMAEQGSHEIVLKEQFGKVCGQRKKTSTYFENGISRGSSNLQLHDVQSESPMSSAVTNSGSAGHQIPETDTAKRNEKQARERVEIKLREISHNKETGETSEMQKQQFTLPETLVKNKPPMIELCESESSNIVSFQSLPPAHVAVAAANSKSLESGGSQRFDIESASSSEYFEPKKLESVDAECQCEGDEAGAYWKLRFEEEKQNHEMLASKLSSVSLERTDLKTQLDVVKDKHKKAVEKKERLEAELKTLIDKIHDMQNEVRLFQSQSTEQIMMAVKDENKEFAELLEMEKLKLKEYYQQQVEAIVQEKVTEFQEKVGSLEKLVRSQINGYTKSMQQKFREKLANASQQQKEVISRLEVEHSKEMERLTSHYPKEVAKLQRCLSDCRNEIIDKKNRLDQRETQVGTILRVIKLLIREGRAMKSDNVNAKEPSPVEVARKILKCLDLDLDDIASPRLCQSEKGTKIESSATFRTIPDSSDQIKKKTSSQPIPEQRQICSVSTIEAMRQTSNPSIVTQPFDTSSATVKVQLKSDNEEFLRKKVAYTCFGDAVLNARSEETIKKILKSSMNKQLSSESDFTFGFGESGTWTAGSQQAERLRAPPPTPPSITTSTGTNTDNVDPKKKDSVQELANSVLEAMGQSPRIQEFVDKATGISASSVTSFIPRPFPDEQAHQLCLCRRLRETLMSYKLSSRRPMRSTRSSSETSLHRLMADLATAKVITGPEPAMGDTNTAAGSKGSSDSTQLFTNSIKESLTKQAAENRGYFSNPFAMRSLTPPRRPAKEKLATKPPIKKGHSVSPIRSSKAQLQTENDSFAAAEIIPQQDIKANAAFVERTISPSKHIPRRNIPTMPSIENFEIIGSKESSEDSKFALKNPVPLMPAKDTRTSSLRKNAALTKPTTNRERHSISPRERKLFTLRKQQSQQPRQAEGPVIRTEVITRKLSPEQNPSALTVSGQPGQSSQQSEQYPQMSFKSLYNARQQQRRRRSPAINMDWDKYIKKGPWKDVYLHDEDTSRGYYDISSRDNYLEFQGAKAAADSDDESIYSPSYSWAPPRLTNRHRLQEYLSPKQTETAEQQALAQFYATPERESASEARRKKKQRKQAEVLNQIKGLLNVSSTSDLVEAERRRSGHSHSMHQSSGIRKSRSFGKPARDSSWEGARGNQVGSPRTILLDNIRRKALASSPRVDRHPMDPLSDVPQHPSRSSNRRVSTSVERNIQIPDKYEFNPARQISDEVKNHMRMARERKKYFKAREVSQDRSPSHRDGRRSSQPTATVISHAPVNDWDSLDQLTSRSRSRSRRSRSMRDIDMDSWVDAWERKWQHERKQRSLALSPHWPPA